MIINDYRLNQLLKNGTVLSAIPLRKSEQYISGSSYFDSYYHKFYTVISVKYREYERHNLFASVTVLWEDGEKITHRTPLNTQRDYKIVLAKPLYLHKFKVRTYYPFNYHGHLKGDLSAEYFFDTLEEAEAEYLNRFYGMEIECQALNPTIWKLNENNEYVLNMNLSFAQLKKKVR